MIAKYLNYLPHYKEEDDNDCMILLLVCIAITNDFQEGRKHFLKLNLFEGKCPTLEDLKNNEKVLYRRYLNKIKQNTKEAEDVYCKLDRAFRKHILKQEIYESRPTYACIDQVMHVLMPYGAGSYWQKL